MRGKEDLYQMHTAVAGITPAYAGKSALPRGQGWPSRDHPRVCGEKKRLSTCAQQAEGSPPRMRGKAVQRNAYTTTARITPAYAGKSSTGSTTTSTTRDHPRVCGEKRQYQPCTGSKQGSPPRMRGKAECLTCCRFAQGITPAYAGKSSLLSIASGFVWDHPRVCGEKPGV